MALNVECTSYRGRKEFSYRDFSVLPGSPEVLNYRGLNVLIIVDVENKKGALILKDSGRNVEVLKFMDESDEKGVKIDPSEAIKLIPGQEVIISKGTRRSTKEVCLYFDEDDPRDVSLTPPVTPVAV